jgi:hypothetical protein
MWLDLLREGRFFFLGVFRRSMDEGRELEEEHSAPYAENSAAPAAEFRWKMFSMKVGEDAEGSDASQSGSNAEFGRVAELGWGNNPLKFWILGNFTHRTALYRHLASSAYLYSQLNYNPKLCRDRAACPTVFLRSQIKVGTKWIYLLSKSHERTRNRKLSCSYYGWRRMKSKSSWK